jgi:hypothetical protein
MADLDLIPAEMKALRSLEKGPQTKAALTKSLDATGLAKLVAAGWIVEVPPTKGAKVARFAITDAGTQAISHSPAPSLVKPARTSQGGTMDAEAFRQIIRAELAELRAELRAENAELRKLLMSIVPSSKSNTDPKGAGVMSFDPTAFRKALKATIPEIDRRDHHDGLVPISKVRRTLAYLGLDRPTFDAAVLEEERAYTVDLKLANDPSRVKEPEGGIFIEGRGLLYFAVLR